MRLFTLVLLFGVFVISHLALAQNCMTFIEISKPGKEGDKNIRLHYMAQYNLTTNNSVKLTLEDFSKVPRSKQDIEDSEIESLEMTVSLAEVKTIIKGHQRPGYFTPDGGSILPEKIDLEKDEAHLSQALTIETSYSDHPIELESTGVNETTNSNAQTHLQVSDPDEPKKNRWVITISTFYRGSQPVHFDLQPQLKDHPPAGFNTNSMPEKRKALIRGILNGANSQRW